MHVQRVVLGNNMMSRFSDPDIEEDDDTCVVTIAPRPIKLKIKPIKPPDPAGAETAGGVEAAAGLTNGGHGVGPTEEGDQQLQQEQHVHPKKKIAQIESILNNFPPAVLSNGGQGACLFQVVFHVARRSSCL